MIEQELQEKIYDIIHDESNVGVDVSIEIASVVIGHFRTTHSRALACHCECLGMNAENAVAVCNNETPPYRDADYFHTTQKWGLTNEKGEPII